MPERVRVELVDDLDGSPAEESVHWGWEGRQLVIDLNKKNAEKFRKAVEAFVAASRADEQAKPARRTPGIPKPTKKRSGASGRQDVATVRGWARENGMTVPDRGRLKPEVLEAYDKAHG